MPEKSLNEPLCGEEIKAITLAEIATALERDTNLYDDIQYAGIRIKHETRIYLKHYVGAEPVETLLWGETVKGEPVTEATADVSTTVALDYSTTQPDVARQDHDLPIPVEAQGPAGPERRMVRIAKRGAARR